METFTDSVTRLSSPQLLFLTLVLLYVTSPPCAASAQAELSRGFKATPDPSIQTFQPVLTDPTGNFSLGFLRVNKTQLALALVHVPSSDPVWLANPAQLARWSDRTTLLFNGSLVLSDPQSKVFWSTHSEIGDRLAVLDTSNVQIQTTQDTVLWQSFDFPTNTLVENQNFTSTMKLVSSNGLYSMRLGNNFMGLFAKFKPGSNADQMYWKRKAMEAKAKVVEGKGPIYARVDPDGFIGMYQTGNPTPVDIQAFMTFPRLINGLRKVRLEADGNLKAYYWDGSNWALDFQAIAATCELPSPCGSFGLCGAGNGSCSCLNNQTEFYSGECFPVQTGDFCGSGWREIKNFRVLRRNGVELPYKELMEYKMMSSYGECERTCERNCSCWGAVYNNGSGFCYLMDYPIQSLVGVADESKMGYFKVREGAGRKKINVGVGVGIGVVCVALLIFVGVVGVWRFRVWRRKRGGGGKRFMGQDGGASPGPYKDLGSASFRSIEMGGQNG
ncbi:PAN domain-containing protein [Pyrus ussuriensis x Pyrus communis]|uniref:PAN domain-containing protein n=1 Tax=Pyrus ussuriensis x Pyrus communis TaxID=2448454 RepID=A0A5N5I1T0_9ROSA|nr:PAN domain-containing protein [Pyrus ussuriensis x Pyrus communis]